jgi:hypothetical protein
VTATKIEVELPTFEVLVSVAECKALKRLCHGKRETVVISLDYPERRTLTFHFVNGKSMTVGNDPDVVDKRFPPVERVFGMEPTGTIPILDPDEFQRALRLALAATRGGENGPKTDAKRNLIRLTSTSRKTTVYGRGNGTRAFTHLDSDHRATPISLILNGAYLLDLIKFAPRSEPYELHQWGEDTKGIAFVTRDFRHFLSGMRFEKVP